MTIQFDSASIVPSIVDVGELFVLSMGVSESALKMWEKFDVHLPALFDSTVRNLAYAAYLQKYKATLANIQATDTGKIHIVTATPVLTQQIVAGDYWIDSAIDPSGQDITTIGTLYRCESNTVTNTSKTQEAAPTSHSQSGTAWVNPTYGYTSDVNNTTVSLAARNVTYPITFSDFQHSLPDDAVTISTIRAKVEYMCSSGATGVSFKFELLENGTPIASMTDVAIPLFMSVLTISAVASGKTVAEINTPGRYSVRLTPSRSTTKLSSISVDYVTIQVDYTSPNACTLNNTTILASSLHKGTFIENVYALPDTYPDNGLQDGYWYIVEGYIEQGTWSVYTIQATCVQETSGFSEMDIDNSYPVAGFITPDDYSAQTDGTILVAHSVAVYAEGLSTGDHFVWEWTDINTPTAYSEIYTVDNVYTKGMYADIFYFRVYSALSPGTYIEDVTAPIGTYPANGVQGGYYYVLI